MKKLQWHRILAFAMTLCMLVSMFPVSAFAAEVEETNQQNVSVILGSSTQVVVDGNLLEQTITDTNGKVNVIFALAEETLTNETPVTQVEDVVDGDYLIFTYHRSLANQDDSTLCYITNEANEAGTSLMRHSAEELTESGWKTAIWTVTKTEGGYTFADCDGKYMHIAQYDVKVADDAQDLTLGVRANDEHENSEHLTISDGTNCLNPQTGGIVNTWTVDNGACMDLYPVKTAITFNGEAVGTTTLTIGGVTYNVVVTEPCAHKYGEVSYAWTDVTSCTASRTCGECQETETATTTAITSEVTQMANCKQNSITAYTATFTEEWAGTTTNSVEGDDKTNDHNYGEDGLCTICGLPCEHSYQWTYVWADDASDCTATGVCSKCQDEQTVKPYKITPLVIQTADCTHNTKTRYYAYFNTDPLPPTGSKELTSEDKLGHSYSYGYCVRCSAVDPEYTSDVSRQGTWGTNASWTLDSNGLLTINCTATTVNATMAAFTDGSTDAWLAYKDQIKAVVIKGQFSNISAYAFDGCKNLTSFVIAGEKMTKIDKYAFRDCASLTAANITSSISEVGTYAFSGCTSLKTLTFGDTTSQRSVGNYAFTGCTSLTEVTIPGYTYVKTGVFSGCTGLTTVTFVSGKGTSSIGTYTFSGCTSLTTVNLPDTVTSISANAFENCTSLNNFVISPKLTKIGANAFAGCTGLETATYDGTKVMWESFKTKIAEGNDALINHVVLPTGVIASGECGLNSDIRWSLDADGVLTIESLDDGGNLHSKGWSNYQTGVKKVVMTGTIKTVSVGVFSGCTNMTEITGMEGVTEIQDEAFMNCTSLTSIDLSTVTKIGLTAFNKSGLTSVTLPAGITLGDRVFKDCTALESVTIEGEVTWYTGKTSYGVFQGCTALKTVTINEGCTSVAKLAFKNCTAITTVYIPSSMENLNSAFSTCKSIDTVVYAGTDEQWDEVQNKSGVETIAYQGTCGETLKWKIDKNGALTIYGTGAMTDYDTANNVAPWAQYADEVTSITIADGPETIGTYAFGSCINAKSMTISGTVTDIASTAFVGTESLASFRISTTDNEGAHFSISEGCLYKGNGNGLTLVAVPAAWNASDPEYAPWYQATAIGDYALAGCKNLTSVTIRNTITSIGDHAFDGCTGLTTLTIPGKNMTLGDNVFANCTGLTTVRLTGSVTSVGNELLAGNDTAIIRYAGTTAEWTAALGENTITNKVICSDTVPESKTVEIILDVDGTYEYTDNDGNFASADTSALNTAIASVAMTGTNATYAAGDKVTELMNGQKYLLLNTRANKLLTNAASSNASAAGATSGLTMTGTTDSFTDASIWIIEETDGGYMVKDLNGNYLSVGANTGATTETPTTLTLSYVASSETWTILGTGNAYLNHFGGDNALGSGYAGPSTDGGSQWHIYELNVTDPGTTALTFTAKKPGTTSVTIGYTTYNITVNGDEPELTQKDVEVMAGKDTVITDETGNYVNDVDKTGLNENIATVTVTGTVSGYTPGEKVTTLTSGQKYLIQSDRHGGYMTTASETSDPTMPEYTATGLHLTTLSGDGVGSDIWTITETTGGYYVQSADGKYVTIGSHAASLTETATVLTIAYNSNGYWTLMKDNCYLNHHGGTTNPNAAGWQDSSASADPGSKFHLYPVVETQESTTITIHGVAAGQTSVVVGTTQYNITVTEAVPDHVYDENGFCKTHTDECEEPYQSATVNADGAYEIGNAGQLYWFAAFVNSGNTTANAVLTKDIVVNESVVVDGAVVEDTTALRTWTPIGRYAAKSADIVTYSGTFDGQNHTISGLYAEGQVNEVFKDDRLGLFGTAANATIRNVGVINSAFVAVFADRSNGKTGSIVGLVEGGAVTITNCWSEGCYLYGMNGIGGIVGYGTSSVTIENCHSSSTVEAINTRAGGIIGYVNLGTVTNCYNTGKISIVGTGSDANNTAGGIVGEFSNHPKGLNIISKCYNTGTIVKGGGIVGQNSGIINDCYNAGNVTGGGIVGSTATTQNAINNCYNIGTVTTQPIAAASANVRNCYYLADTETDGNDNTTAKTAAEFASGEVAYLLNGSTSEGELIWKQNVDNDQLHDASPKFEGSIVYKVDAGYSNTDKPHEHNYNCMVESEDFLATAGNCQTKATYYYSCSCGEKGSETFEAAEVGEHEYVNGFCKHCDDYQSAVLNEQGIYEISNAGQLYWFAALVNAGTVDANAILTDNITINEGTMNADTTDARAWTPIGNEDNCYTGTFDGNNKTISGMYFKDAAAEYVGLIGFTTGTVKNVSIVNSYLWASEWMGSIVGRIYGGSVENCSSSAIIVANNFSCGGIVGYAYSSTSDVSITGCSFSGEVSTVSSSASSIGGIAGYVYGSSDYTVNITKCCNTANISGVKKVAGIAGYLYWSNVNNCYNTGNISGKQYVGGITGHAQSANMNTTYYVERNYNSGTITGTSSYVGSITGYQNGIKHRENYYLTGTATDGNSKVQNAIGHKTAGKVTGDSTMATVKTAEAFASGEVAFLLNGSVCEGELIWKQNQNGDATPNFTGATVHAIYTTCSVTSITGYTNEAVPPKADHVEASEITKAPTCTATGTRKVYCSVCGDTIRNESVDMIDHKYENGVCTGCGAAQPNYIAPVTVEIQVGHTKVITDATGDYTKADITALDQNIATVDLSTYYSSYTVGTAATEITDGGLYMIVNNRASLAMTTGSATWQDYAGLAFAESATDVEVLWIIRKVEGGYTVQSLGGKYLTSGQNAASVGDTADVLTIEYADSNWRISKDGYYLNDAGGQHTCAFFWQESGYEPATDGGSQWTIYPMNGEVGTKITFTGVKAGTTSVTIGKTQYNITVTDCNDHNYVEVVADEYLKSAANCQSAAVYYKSCSYCGAASETDTFTHGDVDSTNHTGTLGDWQHDADKHWKEYSCCGAHAEETAHDDENHNHACDTCGATVSECADTNNDHYCDVCDKELTQCVDENKDHKCDICGATMGEHKAADGSHICDYCGKAVSDCVDSNKDHECDICGATMGEHKAAEGSHDCAYCGKPVTECVDENKDHNCDVCGKELSDCVDDNHDGKCDICGKVLSYVTRLSGKNRYITAIKVADELKEVLGVEKFDTIIVAAGENFADALSGSYLSTMKNAPILLCYNGNGNHPELDAQNIAYIKENLAENGTVYILGGTAAVNDSYESELANYNVERLRGKNRFGTNQAILKEAGIPAGSEILVCTAYKYADSLSASATGKPILLVHNQDGTLYGVDEEFLSTLENCTFTIIGGTGAVGSEFEEILEQYGEVNRLSGKTRYQTSILVAETYFDEPTTAVMAYAWNYPDGLCGGTLAHAKNAPLILTESGSEDAAVAYTTANNIHSGYVLGGAKFISDDSARTILGLSADFEVVAK